MARDFKGRKLGPMSELWPLRAQQPEPHHSHTAEVTGGLWDSGWAQAGILGHGIK